MQNNETKIIVIVALYHPNELELDNICCYIEASNMCLIMDDSEIDNKQYVTFFFEKHNIKNFKYYWNKKNIGLCASVNRGIEIALKNNADWILLMNGDSKMFESTIISFREYINMNNTDNVACIAPQYNYDRHPRTAYDGIKKILWANMSGMCINCNALKNIGMFDERYFVDGLDVDWGIRAHRAGYKMYEIGTAIMEHHPAETRELTLFGRCFFKYGWASPIRYYYQFRSNHYMICHYKSFESFKWQVIKLLKVILLFDNKKEYLKMLKKAIKDCKNDNWGKYSET